MTSENIIIDHQDGLCVDSFEGPCCPHCHYEEDIGRGFNYRNGEKHVRECESCGEEFECTMTISAIFSNRVIL